MPNRIRFADSVTASRALPKPSQTLSRSAHSGAMPEVVLLDRTDVLARSGRGLGRKAVYVAHPPGEGTSAPGGAPRPVAVGKKKPVRTTVGGSLALAEIRQAGEFHRRAAADFATTLRQAEILARGSVPLMQAPLREFTSGYLQAALAILDDAWVTLPPSEGNRRPARPNYTVLMRRLARCSELYLDLVCVILGERE